MTCFSANNRTDYIIQLVQATKQDSILTVGVSNIPEIEMKLSLIAKDYTILDIDVEKLNYAKSKLPEVLMIRGDITNTNLFTKQKFSTVIMLEVLEHLVDDFGTLKNISDLLRKNGKLIISVPNKNLFHMLNPLLYTQHKRHYSLYEISLLLKRAGFAIVHTNTVESPKMLFDLYVHLFCKYILKRTFPFGILTNKIDRTYTRDNPEHIGLDSVIVAVKL